MQKAPANEHEFRRKPLFYLANSNLPFGESVLHEDDHLCPVAWIRGVLNCWLGRWIGAARAQADLRARAEANFRDAPITSGRAFEFLVRVRTQRHL